MNDIKAINVIIFLSLFPKYMVFVQHQASFGLVSLAP